MGMCAEGMSAEECLEFDRNAPECAGAVELRDALSASGIPYKRCDKHWEARIRKQHELELAYPDSPMAPEWFDPTYAGERWDDDY